MNIDNIVTDYNERIKEMREGLTNTLKEAFKEVFTENPNLYMITWTQYAPYFNDGDPCEFSVHELYAVNKDVLEDEEYDEDSLPSPWEFEDEFSKYRMSEPSWGEEAKAAWAASSEEYKQEAERVDAFLTTISSIDEDVFKAAFGEDNAVYVFADRIVTEDFSGNHD